MRIVAVFGVLMMSVMGFASEGPSPAEGGAALVVTADGQSYNIGLSGAEPFYSTQRLINEMRLIAVPESPTLLALWRETSASGDVVSHYAISLDGQKFSRACATSYILRLRYSNFDPLVTLPQIPDVLTADPATNEVYIVQFHTQPMEQFRQAIRDLGGIVHKFVNEHAHIVRMTPEVRDLVADLPYVRWVGALHPAYRLEELLIDEIKQGSSSAETRKYSIMLHERGPWPQQLVADRIQDVGGELFRTIPAGYRVEAFLTIDQVRRIASMNEIMFVDIRGDLELDMDIARQISGADYIENMGGYTGEGVRAEVADTGVDVNHPDWKYPPIIHNNNSGSPGHGTSVYGICFGTGKGDPRARGLMPDAQGIFANATPLRGLPNTRHEHTAELVDPNGPYRAVFQTNSTGDPRTRDYTTISADMDDILFINDIVHCQSMSNANGTPDVRPQAWAKNMVSVGGITHRDTLDRGDDYPSGSSGPAKDGRIKPTLAHFYDKIHTTAAGGGYTEFGGTSGATPITCGHIGLFFQMWADGIFGNPVGGGDPFDEKAHLSTAKAMMVNTAYLYPLSQIVRIKQGWGMVNLKTMFDLRSKFYIIDETDILEELDVAVHEVEVEPDTPRLAATLVYLDPMGVPLSQKHRINDLTLQVISPSGTEYWGNYGLMNNNESTPGGTSNDVDTVENVFIADPEPGIWAVKVFADEINEDSHVETPQVDADYALVVSGVRGADPKPGACCDDEGNCEDLLHEECIAQGGDWYFGKECATFECPIPGACCVDNATCKQMLKKECERLPGAIFVGEGVSCRRACRCDHIKKFKAKCTGGGTIKAKLKHRDERHNGEIVTFRIDDHLKLDVEIIGKKAKLYTCCYNGPHTVHLLEPDLCEDPIEVHCPE